MNRHKVERKDDAGKRDGLQYAAQELIENDDFKSGKDKYDAVEQDPEFGKWYAKDIRILTQRDDIAPRQILDIAEKRSTVYGMLGEVYGVCQPEKGKHEDEYDTHSFHTVQDTRCAASVQMEQQALPKKICYSERAHCMLPFLSQLIDGSVNNVMLLSLAIILCAFVFEDLTTIIVGVLAADGFISIPLALLSLYVGIMLGDSTLYSIGFLARTHKRLAHYIDHDFTASFRSWLQDRYAVIIFSGHFVPGLRFTTYIASGFFRFPLSAFVPKAIAGGLLLGTILFSLSYWFGDVTSDWIGPARWGMVALFLLVLFFIGRYNLLAYRAQKNGLREPASKSD